MLVVLSFIVFPILPLPHSTDDRKQGQWCRMSQGWAKHEPRMSLALKHPPEMHPLDRVPPHLGDRGEDAMTLWLTCGVHTFGTRVLLFRVQTVKLKPKSVLDVCTSNCKWIQTWTPFVAKLWEESVIFVHLDNYCVESGSLQTFTLKTYMRWSFVSWSWSSE